MNEKVGNVMEITENLKKELTKPDLTLELYYDDDLSNFEKEIFTDYKLSQQSALN